MRQQLAQALVAVLAQQLLFREEQAIPIYELLLNTPAIANLIREGKFHQLCGQLEQATQEGMMSFRQSFERSTVLDRPELLTRDKDAQTNFLK